VPSTFGLHGKPMKSWPPTYAIHSMSIHQLWAAVLARHLADNHVKPDAAQGSKIATLKKAVKSINGRMDAFQAAIKKEPKSVGVESSRKYPHLRVKIKMPRRNDSHKISLSLMTLITHKPSGSSSLMTRVVTRTFHLFHARSQLMWCNRFLAPSQPRW